MTQRPTSFRRLAGARFALFVFVAWLAGEWGTIGLQASSMIWERLSSLPAVEGRVGAFIGASGDALIFAGGASVTLNGSDAIKNTNWHDHIWVLREADGSWEETAIRLPRPLAFGIAISSEDALFCAGGRDADQLFAEVISLRWESGELRQRAWPALPEPTAYGCGAVLGTKLYVAPGITEANGVPSVPRFWSLDLSEPDAPWEEEEPWPGPVRQTASAGVQDGAFFLIGGEDVRASTMLLDMYRFVPDAGWERLADLPQPIIGAPDRMMTLGQSHLLVLGAGARHSTANAESGGVLAYHTITDTWTDGSDWVSSPQGPDHAAGPWPGFMASATDWRGRYVMAGGMEVSGATSAEVRGVRIESARPQFGWVNFVVLFAYLGGMVGMGVFFARRNRNTNDFFRGGQHIPWWVAGLSIFATMLSSLTYMSVPAKAFATNWEYLVGYPFILLTAAFVVWCVLPFFRGIDATSAYEYLEKRFSRSVRQIGSALFILFQTGRMAIVMFLSALALRAILGLPVSQCILLMGLLSVLYSTLGGVEAVVWTDAVQSLVLLAGAALSLGLVLWHLDGGLEEFVRVASADEKFHMINWNWNAGSYATAAFWVLALGALGQNLSSYTSDQAVVQRYMTTSSRKLAARSIWTNGLMAIPAGLLFFLLGTALYVFYKTRPERLDPTFATDAIFPLFITRELPAGISGLVVAGIFAAAQSTISTSMNSMATAFVTDFARPWHLLGNDNERGYLSMARWATGLAGVTGTGLALIFGSSDIKSLLDQFFAVLGLFGGSLGGVFLLGMFSRRANAAGALAGALLGAAVTFWVQQATATHVYLHAGIGMATCIGLGWILSLCFPRSRKQTDKLTVFTR